MGIKKAKNFLEGHRKLMRGSNSYNDNVNCHLLECTLEAFAEPDTEPEEGEGINICPKCKGRGTSLTAKKCDDCGVDYFVLSPDLPFRFEEGDLVRDKYDDLCLVQAMNGSTLSVWTSTSDHRELYNAWRKSSEVEFLERNWHFKTYKQIKDKLTGS